MDNLEKEALCSREVTEFYCKDEISAGDLKFFLTEAFNSVLINKTAPELDFNYTDTFKHYTRDLCSAFNLLRSRRGLPSFFILNQEPSIFPKFDKKGEVHYLRIIINYKEDIAYKSYIEICIDINTKEVYIARFNTTRI